MASHSPATRSGTECRAWSVRIGPVCAPLPRHRATPRRLEANLEARPDLRRRIDRLVRAVRPGRPRRLKRQPDGTELDIDAVLDAEVAWRAGETADERLYRSSALRARDLATLVLIDVSEFDPCGRRAGYRARGGCAPGRRDDPAGRSVRIDGVRLRWSRAGSAHAHQGFCRAVRSRAARAPGGACTGAFHAPRRGAAPCRRGAVEACAVSAGWCWC